jgi:hypothetical protein
VIYATLIGALNAGAKFRVGRGCRLTSSRRCIASVAWLFAACLLVSAGGATALADAGSDNADSSSAAEGPAASSGTGATTATGGEAPSAHDDAATTHGVSQQPAPRSGVGGSDPSDPTTVITRTVTGTVGQVSADAAPTNDDAAPTSDATPPTDTAPTGEVALPPTDDPPPAANGSAAVTSDDGVPANDPPASGSDQVPSASDTSSSDPTAASAAPNLEEQESSQGVPSSSDTASSPDQTASSPDVISMLAEVLTSTTAAVAQIPADLAHLLGATDAEVQLLSHDASTRTGSAASGGTELSPLQILGLLNSPFAGKATEIPTLLDGSNQTRSDSAASAFGTTTALAGTSSTSVAARVEPDAALPEGLQTFLHSCGEIIVVVSLSAMFAAALPGLVGLVIPAVAGMHIGYRQAKAGRAIHGSGIARLAASGPIGVVRSGSLVALRPQKWRVPPPNSGDLSQDVA